MISLLTLRILFIAALFFVFFSAAKEYQAYAQVKAIALSRGYKSWDLLLYRVLHLPNMAILEVSLVIPLFT